jgi:hypothetical protein
MKNITKAIYLITLSVLLNTIISFICYIYRGLPEFKGYLTGAILSFILSFLWILGARRGMKANILILLRITLIGFPVRLLILAIFTFGGLYILKMDLIYFTISFLIGTVMSLIIEVWLFNTLRLSDNKKI